MEEGVVVALVHSLFALWNLVVRRYFVLGGAASLAGFGEAQQRLVYLVVVDGAEV